MTSIHSDEKVRREVARERSSDRRRKAFLRFMRDHELQVADWARQAGLPGPNAIYNFLAGRSKSLSLDTARRLADVIPGKTVDDLFGESPEKREREDRFGRVPMRMIARAGVWRRSPEIPWADRAEISIVQPAEHRLDEAVLVGDGSCDLIFPQGTYAMVGHVPPRLGDAVVVVATRETAGLVEHEVTIREIHRRPGGGAALVTRSSSAQDEEVDLPWPLPTGRLSSPSTPRMWFEIVGVVLLAQLSRRPGA